MSDDTTVIQFPGGAVFRKPKARETHVIDPANVIEAAASHGLKQVVVIGITKDDEFYLAASPSHLSDALMMVERAKAIIVRTELSEC